MSQVQNNSSRRIQSPRKLEGYNPSSSEETLGDLFKVAFKDADTKDEVHEFTLRVHVIEAKHLLEAIKSEFATDVSGKKLCPVVRCSWLKRVTKEEWEKRNGEDVHRKREQEKKVSQDSGEKKEDKEKHGGASSQEAIPQYLDGTDFEHGTKYKVLCMNHTFIRKNTENPTYDFMMIMKKKDYPFQAH